MKTAPIFIHALFRTGSTYIWDKFRQLPNHVCYYEPFHQFLASVTAQNIRDTLTKNFKAAGHPELDRHYLYEYEALLREDAIGVPFFKKELSFDWFCQAGGENIPEQKKYIDFLIQAAGARIPLFQFNRTALRSGWFKSVYPDSLNIYLYRNPRDQWQSYAAIQARTGYDLFFIMDLLAVCKNRESDLIRPLGHAIPLLKYHSTAYADEELFYRTLSRAYGEKEKYFIFYYLWLISLLENILHADLLWDINLLADDEAYRKNVQQELVGRHIGPIDLDDCHITGYSEFPLPLDAMAEIEAQVQALIAGTFADYLSRIKKVPPQLQTLFRVCGIEKLMRIADKQAGSLLGDWLQKDKVIRLLREELQNRENQLEEKKASVVLLENKVNILLGSHSFRIGRSVIFPLRLAKKMLLRLKTLPATRRLPSDAYHGIVSVRPEEKKIAVAEQLHLDFGRHRSGLKYGLQYLLSLHHQRGVILDAFIERTFSWQPQRNFAYDKSWIGFIHIPPHLPEWFHPQVGNGAIFMSEGWQKSLPKCRGLFAFSRYHQRHLQDKLAIPVETLLLPSETPRLTWSMEAFDSNPQKRIIQVGWWLRKLHAIFQLPQTDFQKVFLHVGHPDLANLMAKEREIMIRAGAFKDVDADSVSTIPFVSNQEYDLLLSKNIAFISLYDSSACNAIVECMVRRTPLLINPLEAVVEYLGENYPFYFASLPEAAAKLMNRDLIYRTHEYLCALPRQRELNGEYFLKSFTGSEIYRSLAPLQS